MHHRNYGMQNPYGNQHQGDNGGMGYGNQTNPMMNMPQMQQGANQQDVKDQMNGYQHYFIILEMKDGQQYEGIIEDMDAENVYILMPIGDEDDDQSSDQRQWGYGYGPGWGYGYPRRFRRFRRYRFPFFGIGRWYFPFFW